MPSRLLLTVVVVLAAARLSHAQHQGHTPPANDGAAAVAAGSARIPDLLRVSDSVVRGIAKAIAQSDPRLLGDSVAGYISTVEAITASVELADPQLSAGELGRAEKTLSRQGQRLRVLDTKSPEFRESLDAAYDAGQRARDAIGAARDRARDPSPSAGEHVSRGSGRGCRHH